MKKCIIILTGLICFNLAIAQPTYNFYPDQKLSGNNDSRLDYFSNNSTLTQFKFMDKEGTRYGSIYGTNDGTNFGLLDGDSQWSYLAAKDDYTAFRINNVERMRIEDNGSVGIGTTTPEEKLHVKGNVKVGSGNWGTLKIDGKDRNDWMLNAHNSGKEFFIRTQRDNGEADWSFTVMSFIRATGNVGIGTNVPEYKLDVCGTIRAEEVLVEDGWCDYVFEPEYCLTTLEEEKEFIELYGHLSNFESAKDMNGLINVNDIFKRQQIQIEENVLHLIELNADNKALQLEVDELKANYTALAKELAELKAELKE